MQIEIKNSLLIEPNLASLNKENYILKTFYKVQLED